MKFFSCSAHKLVNFTYFLGLIKRSDAHLHRLNVEKNSFSSFCDKAGKQSVLLQALKWLPVAVLSC